MAMSKSSNQPPTGSVPLPGSKRGPRAFFHEVGRELKKVSWPAKSETNRMTGVVLIMCAIAIVFLYGLQEAFHIIVQLLTEGF